MQNLNSLFSQIAKGLGVRLSPTESGWLPIGDPGGIPAGSVAGFEISSGVVIMTSWRARKELSVSAPLNNVHTVDQPDSCSTGVPDRAGPGPAPRISQQQPMESGWARRPGPPVRLRQRLLVCECLTALRLPVILAGQALAHIGVAASHVLQMSSMRILTPGWPVLAPASAQGSVRPKFLVQQRIAPVWRNLILVPEPPGFSQPHPHDNIHTQDHL